SKNLYRSLADQEAQKPEIDEGLKRIILEVRRILLADHRACFVLLWLLYNVFPPACPFRSEPSRHLPRGRAAPQANHLVGWRRHLRISKCGARHGVGLRFRRRQLARRHDSSSSTGARRCRTHVDRWQYLLEHGRCTGAEHVGPRYPAGSAYLRTINCVRLIRRWRELGRFFRHYFWTVVWQWDPGGDLLQNARLAHGRSRHPF